jgi:hypothetical protein
MTEETHSSLATVTSVDDPRITLESSQDGFKTTENEEVNQASINGADQKQLEKIDPMSLLTPKVGTERIVLP